MGTQPDTPATEAQQSHDEIRELLHAAILDAERLRSDAFILIRDVYDDAVIYAIGGDERTLYRRGYTIDEQNRVTLTDPEPVIRRVDYEPVTEAVKIEDGQEYPARCYLHVPDPDSPSTWKLRVCEIQNGEPTITVAQLGRAAAALSPGGFRGNRVQLTPEERRATIAKLRRLYRELDAEPPESLQEAVDAAVSQSSAGGEAPDAATGDIRETAPLSDGHLLESADAGEGWRWRVQVIQAGVSRNRTEYPLEVLHRRASLYEGVPVFYSDGPDHDPNRRGFGSVAGWITEARPNPRGVEGTLEINRGRPDLRETFLQAWQIYQKTGRLPFGFSHVVPAGHYRTTIRRLAEGVVRRIEDFDAVESVDVVMRPSAGGELLGLVAAVDESAERSVIVMGELLERLRRGEELTEAEHERLRAEVTAADYLAAVEAGKQARAAANADKPASEASGDLREAARSEIEEIKRLRCETLLERTLANCTLPEPLKEAIRQDFAGRVFEEAELTSRIERERDIYAKLLESHGIGQPGSGRPDVEVSQDQVDRWQRAMDGMFGLVRGATPREDNISLQWYQTPEHFRSLREAYRTIVGREPTPRDILAEAAGANYTGERLSEAINSSTFSAILGDSIRRRMIAEYARPDLQDFMKLVSEVSTIPDFRTNHRMRLGGYGDLPKVTEGSNYQPLTSPNDEGATYAVEKYGGTEELTFETIQNDDMGVVRQIPVRLGRAAIYTLRHAIFVSVLAQNPTTTYDSKALFHVDHGNLGSSALSHDAMVATRLAMRKQQFFGETNRMGQVVVPVRLFVPPDLEEIAIELALSTTKVTPTGDSTIPNMFRGLDVVVVDEWADPSDWVAAADPRNVPIIELGYLEGRTEPEVFVQDMPAVGSMFTADKITYKIRHIWGYVILDHRGLYKHVVADS